jgi:DNA-binding MarR family transcriptional regulator
LCVSARIEGGRDTPACIESVLPSCSVVFPAGHRPNRVSERGPARAHRDAWKGRSVSDRNAVIEDLVASWRIVNRAIDRIMLPRLIELDLTMSQFKALIAVTTAGPGGISVTELGTELSIGQPSASLIVDQLVRPGYVERVPDSVDRRRVLVTTTQKGLDVADDLRQGRRSNFRGWLTNISDEDVEALEKGMRGLAFVVQASRAGRPSAP